MTASSMLFTSREVRWFLDGGRREHAALVDWFATAMPVNGGRDRPAPTWQGRLDDQPDLYLLIPAAVDMGIKWREGLLQIKGRRRAYRDSAFGSHAGRVECWTKWSYAALPSPWRELFTPNTPPSEIVRIPVHKQRLLRLFRFGPAGSVVELATATRIDRGASAELTEVSVGGRHFLTLGFEAFPDDDVVAARFDAFVTDFLESLDSVKLHADMSLSYPAWLSLEFD